MCSWLSLPPTCMLISLSLSVVSTSSCSICFRALSDASRPPLSSSISPCMRHSRLSWRLYFSLSSSCWRASSSICTCRSWVRDGEGEDYRCGFYKPHGFFFKHFLKQSSYFDLLLQLLQGFDQLSVVPVGVVQLNLHLIQVSLHLLLHPHSLGTTFGLRLQAGLQRLHCTHVVLPEGIKQVRDELMMKQSSSCVVEQVQHVHSECVVNQWFNGLLKGC